MAWLAKVLWRQCHLLVAELVLHAGSSAISKTGLSLPINKYFGDIADRLLSMTPQHLFQAAALPLIPPKIYHSRSGRLHRPHDIRAIGKNVFRCAHAPVVIPHLPERFCDRTAYTGVAKIAHGTQCRKRRIAVIAVTHFVDQVRSLLDATCGNEPIALLPMRRVSSPRAA